MVTLLPRKLAGTSRAKTAPAAATAAAAGDGAPAPLGGLAPPWGGVCAARTAGSLDADSDSKSAVGPVSDARRALPLPPLPSIIPASPVWCGWCAAKHDAACAVKCCV